MTLTNALWNFAEVDIPEPKPEPVPLAEVEDEDDESNWMNLDEYTKEQLRNRPKPKDRDLNPDDIGKKQFLDDFSCAVSPTPCIVFVCMLVVTVFMVLTYQRFKV